eukprot:6676754-Alexandrium_andersonii.AAC.1
MHAGGARPRDYTPQSSRRRASYYDDDAIAQTPARGLRRIHRSIIESPVLRGLRRRLHRHERDI